MLVSLLLLVAIVISVLTGIGTMTVSHIAGCGPGGAFMLGVVVGCMTWIALAIGIGAWDSERRTRREHERGMGLYRK